MSEAGIDIQFLSPLLVFAGLGLGAKNSAVHQHVGHRSLRVQNSDILFSALEEDLVFITNQISVIDYETEFV